MMYEVRGTRYEVIKDPVRVRDIRYEVRGTRLVLVRGYEVRGMRVDSDLG
jgi:hypothetical protein